MGGIIEDGKVDTNIQEGRQRDGKRNYRGVVMLAMGSRIHARFFENRFEVVGKHLQLLHDNHKEFRQGRSSADATQILARMQEDMEDIKKRKTSEAIDRPNYLRHPEQRLREGCPTY